MSESVDDLLLRIKKQLSIGAAADAIHDFSKYLILSNRKSGESIKLGIPDILSAIPVPDDVKIDNDSYMKEDDLLGEIFKEIIPSDFNISKLIDYLIENTGETYSKVIDIPGIKSIPHTYTIKILNTTNNTNDPNLRFNIRNMYDKISIDEYKEFFNLSGTDALNIVVDAQTIGINQLFSYAKSEGTRLTVNNIINREVINDPAPKTYNPDNLGLGKGKTKGYADYNIVYDNEESNILYPKFNEKIDNEFYRNMFFSTLDFTLSKLIMEGGKLPRINMDISSDKQYIYHTDNPHLANGIESCWLLIKKAFGIKGTQERHIKCSAFFQCKRSGDWLQALSCLDNKRTYSPRIDGSIKLVTHDRILLWYALFLGIDVIFTCKKEAINKHAHGKGEHHEKSSEVDDDDWEKDPTGKKSQKIMLYFTAIRETDEERLTRYTKKVEAIDINIYNAYSRNYSLWIEEIKELIQTEIKEKITAIIDLIKVSGRKPSTLGKLTKEYIQIYWKVVSLDFKEIHVPALTNAGQGPTLKDLEDFLSKCENFKSIMEKIPNKEEILILSKNYQMNEAYIKMINPFDILDKQSESIILDKVMTLVSHLEFRIDDVYIEQLKGDLSTIIEEVKTKWNDITDTYAIEIIISSLSKIKKTDIIIIEKIVEASLKKKAKESSSVGGAAGPPAHGPAAVENSSNGEGEELEITGKPNMSKEEFLAEVENEEIEEEVKVELKERTGVVTRSQAHKLAAEESVKLLKKESASEKPELSPGELREKIKAEKQLEKQRVIQEAEIEKARLIQYVMTRSQKLKKAAADADAAAAAAASAADADAAISKRLIKEKQLANLAFNIEPDLEEANVLKRIDKRKSKTIFAITNAFFIKYASELIKIIQYHGGYGAGEGGGNNQQPYYVLILCYLNTLVEAIYGFDTYHSTDYIYYEILARIVLSCINLHINCEKPKFHINCEEHKLHNNCEELLYLLYSVIPDHLHASIGISEGSKNCVKIVAENIALQSINIRNGNIPDIFRTGIQNNMLKSEAFQTIFKKYSKDLDAVNFKVRKIFIINELAKLILTLKPSLDNTNVSITYPVVSYPLTARRSHAVTHYRKHFNPPAPAHTHLRIKAGGEYRTRYNKQKIYKGKKGSPRRKTLRKTRRHK